MLPVSKKLDEKGRVYIKYTDYGNKTNRGGLRHMKVENKSVRQYENLADPDHCVVNLFVKYFDFIPSRDKHFYFRPLPNDGTGVPRFGQQPVGRNTLAQIIPNMCKAAGIEGRKTGHSGKVTSATALYQQNYSDQLIRERTGHRSLEALHKYKRTGSDQQYDVSMALLPCLAKLEENDKENRSVAKVEEKENQVVCDSFLSSAKKCKVKSPPKIEKETQFSDDDDFVPLKKKPKISPEDVKAMFRQSTLTNCTFNINFSSK